MRWVLVLMAAVAANSAAEEMTKGQMVEGLRRVIILRSDCAPIHAVRIDELSDEAMAMGFTERAIRKVAIPSLEGIPLVTHGQPSLDELMLGDVKHYLLVRVTVVGIGVGIYVSLQRHLPDTGYTMPGFVSVWHWSGTGIAPTAQFVLGQLPQAFDAFADDYLSANEGKCEP